MTDKKSNKTLLIVGVILAVVLVIACGVLYTVFTTNNWEYQKHVDEYLDVYGEKAVSYLRGDEDFVSAYGSDCELDVNSWSYRYIDPQKYPTFSFKLKYPATLEEFERDLKRIQVGIILPDSRSCTVQFEKTPEGALEIVGWEYADEE